MVGSVVWGEAMVVAGSVEETSPETVETDSGTGRTASVEAGAGIAFRSGTTDKGKESR